MASQKKPVSSAADNNAPDIEIKSPEEEALSKYNFGNWRVDVTCPYCGYEGRTVIKKRPGRVPWILCVVLLFTIPFLSCLPVLMPSMMDIHHHCIKCDRRLGVRKIY
ncbi:unnamed protein product [Blepharisma stoltei]|uniref:LITAF domain-containing protein n=1 Tax=Blepharisma stoltei TaxID=1481888 RepID=A0AAU9IJV6_9CILI|nr:unnamed protein product [Blepharisma stoltei]